MKFSSSFTTTNLQFCNRTVQNIVTPSFKQSILDTLFKRFSFVINQKRYQSFQKKQESKVTNHLLTTVSGGSDYVLFLTTDPMTHVSLSILIDCSIQSNHDYPKMVILHTRFSPELYSDTLFIGKLNRDIHKQWSFIIGDIIIHRGIIVTDNLLQRLQLLKTIFTTHYQPDSVLQTLPFLLKHYFNINEYQTICDTYIPSLPYKTIGLFFYPISYGSKPLFYFFKKSIPFNIQSNTNSSLLNIPTRKMETKQISQPQQTQQPQSTNSLSKTVNLSNKKKVSFSVKTKTSIVCYLKPTSTLEIYKLLVTKNQKLKKIGYAHISNLSMNQQIKEQFQSGEQKKIVVCCSYNSQFSKWSPETIETNSTTVMSWSSYQELLKTLS